MYPLLALCGENRRTAARRPKSDVEAEEDDVAVLHHVLLALAAHEALFLGGGHRAAGHQVVERDDLRADEAALKVAVDFAGGLRRFRTLRDRPCAHLGLAGREVGDQAEQSVAGVDEAVEARFREAHVAEEQRFFLGVHAGDLRLDLGADRQHGRVLRVGDLLHRQIARVVLDAVRKIGFAHVGRKDDRLVRQQADGGEELLFLLGAFHAAGRLPGVERRVHALEEIDLELVLLVGLDHLLRLVDAAVEHLDVGEDQLEVDRLDVARRVDRAFDVDDVVVLKAAYDVHDGVDLADVREELVAEALAFRGALHEAGDIDELDRRGREFFRLIHFGELVEALVRHRDDADVRLDRAERIVCGLCSCFC